ncbi:type II toxin-antitoxin system VapC family toxin [Terracidiphilus gabretensis]|jgi:predicted nucleic acid-binding protein|uniref:type II toxin-antitoxin system VapC family toxin n=1 Tax=Terracidiphilus gabretensis TaxID=1577687 RepID=UPI00071B7003|nr:PIN domain nuclease [Terracidiphilus gabretensis]
MVIVDSSAWIDFLNQKLTPQTQWLRNTQGTVEIGLTTLVLAEVLHGIRFDGRFRVAERLFRTMTIFESPTIPIAIQSASNYRSLRALGITVRSTIDCLIATFCIEHSHQLLHNDRDFDAFETHLGLRVIHPPALSRS